MKVTLHKVFVCTTVALAFLLCVPGSLRAQNSSHGIRTIVIDPGHGGTDPGCVWGKVYEKDIVLTVGLQLGEMIKKNLPDVKVVYTRDKDVFVDLYKRGDLANKVKADLFVSIHVNSSGYKSGPNPPAGTETFVMGANKAEANLDLVTRENNVILFEKDYQKNYGSFDPKSPESYIIFSLLQYANTDQSINLARSIQKQYNRNIGFADRGVKQAGLLVLWRTTMPSVLTEIGFINNPAERAFMTMKDGQKKTATSLFNAISEYKAKVEGNSNPIILDLAYEPSPAAPETTTSYIPDTGEPAGSGTIQNTPEKTMTWTFSSNPVVYRVQIHSVPRKLSLTGRELAPFKKQVTERKVGSTYKYYVGSCSTYAEATALQAEVRKTVKDAFLVAFDGDKQITVSEARKLTK